MRKLSLSLSLFIITVFITACASNTNINENAPDMPGNTVQSSLEPENTSKLKSSVESNSSLEWVAGQNSSSSGVVMEKEVKTALDLPLEYQFETAVSNGDVVNLHGKISNPERLQKFLESVESKKTDLIRITSYTIEGDPIITVLFYDGNVIKYYCDNTRDAFGGDKGIRLTEANEITLSDEKVKYDDNNIRTYKRYKLVGGKEELTFLSIDADEGTSLSKISAGDPSALSSDDEAAKLRTMEKAFMESVYFVQEHMIPLTVTRDSKYFIVYKTSKEKVEDENERILVGMPRQTVDLFRVDLASRKAVNIGKSEFVVNYAWSEDGRLLSLVSHGSVKILDIISCKLSEVPIKYGKDGIYNTNWELDNHTLNIHLDTVANYYVYDTLSKNIKKTRGGFAEGDVVFRGMAGGKAMTSRGERVGVAGGLYLGDLPGKLLLSEDTIIHDMYRSRILISHKNGKGTAGYVLEEYDTTSGESRILYYGDIQGPWKIFKATYLKTTGEILYTTFEADEKGVSYLLVRIGQDGRKTAVEVPSPLYSVTPGEGFLNFAVFYDGEGSLMDTSDFQFTGQAQVREYKNREIRDLMFRALAIYSSETPDPDKIKQVFINSYDTIPQEALENILLEAGKTGYWKYSRLEIGKDITMTVKLNQKGNRASVVLNNLYFRGPHELVKEEGRWYITGLSTWPESKVRKDVYNACTRYIEDETKSGKLNDKIGAPYSGIEVGEIEIWAMSDPHRAIYPDAYANEARVKIIVTRQNGIKEKFLANFSKRNTGGIWKCISLGKLSPSLFPGE